MSCCFGAPTIKVLIKISRVGPPHHVRHDALSNKVSGPQTVHAAASKSLIKPNISSAAKGPLRNLRIVSKKITGPWGEFVKR